MDSGSPQAVAERAKEVTMRPRVRHMCMPFAYHGGLGVRYKKSPLTRVSQRAFRILDNRELTEEQAGPMFQQQEPLAAYNW